jgi:hypothetical protein
MSMIVRRSSIPIAYRRISQTIQNACIAVRVLSIRCINPISYICCSNSIKYSLVSVTVTIIRSIIRKALRARRAAKTTQTAILLITHSRVRHTLLSRTRIQAISRALIHRAHIQTALTKAITAPTRLLSRSLRRRKNLLPAAL